MFTARMLLVKMNKSTIGHFFSQIQVFTTLNSKLSCGYCPIIGPTIRAMINDPSLVVLGIQNIINIGMRISYANHIRCYFRTFYLKQPACFGKHEDLFLAVSSIGSK